jgi:hypothetical protein
MDLHPLPLPPVGASYAAALPCKCCGAGALLDGYADFDRDCYGVNQRRGRARGVPVPYYRCRGCDFTFTDAFDAWDGNAFRTHVYNDEYAQFDPRFAEERPRTTTAFVQRLFPDPATRILDWGGGNGRTAELLRATGYAQVTEYDPFHGTQQQRPEAGAYDLVLCIEVAEHHCQPLALFAELDAWAGERGCVLMSTRDFADVKGRWVDDWYVAPRNGHLSFYSQRTLRLLAASLGRGYHRVDGYRHLLGPRADAPAPAPAPEGSPA